MVRTAPAAQKIMERLERSDFAVMKRPPESARLSAGSKASGPNLILGARQIGGSQLARNRPNAGLTLGVAKGRR
jgi:hypothetical protein